MRDSDGGSVAVVAVLRQEVEEAGCGVAIRTRDLADAETVLPEDQYIRIKDPGLSVLCGNGAALLRVGDLSTAGVGRRVALADGTRFQVVLDRAAFVPLNGFAVLPFIPSESAVAGLTPETRDALFLQESRLRYPAAAEALTPNVVTLNAREAGVAIARIWTKGSDAGSLGADPQPTVVSTSCAPGTSGPQLLQPFSGRSQRQQITF